MVDSTRPVTGASGSASADADASSLQVLATEGVPATWNRPVAVSSTTSAGSASSSSAASEPRPASTSASVAWWTAAPPTCSEREPKVPVALGHQVGVARDHLDVVERDAGQVAGDHGPRRAVPLAVGRRAREDDGPTVGAHLDLGELGLAGRGPGGDLDVGRDPDAELHRVAGLTPPGLLGPQRVVAGGRQGPVERARVVAAVVGGAGLGGVGEGVSGDQVAPPHLGRVEPISAANRSMARSMAALASGRPAPR